MFGKSKFTKDSVTKLTAMVMIASVFLLTMSILTDDNDSRKQISDDDGATETTLCSILSEIQGVGEVKAMVRYDEKNAVTGVIVTAQGAKDPVIKSNIVKGVSALFDIPISSVMVFEKKQEESVE